MKNTLKAVSFVAAVGLWSAFASVAAAWPNQDSDSPVARIEQTYTDINKKRRVALAVKDLITANGFSLIGGFGGPWVVDDSVIYLEYTRASDGIEIAIDTTKNANTLEVYFYDRVKKGTWREIKEKVEALIRTAASP